MYECKKEEARTGHASVRLEFLANGVSSPKQNSPRRNLLLLPVPSFVAVLNYRVEHRPENRPRIHRIPSLVPFLLFPFPLPSALLPPPVVICIVSRGRPSSRAPFARKRRRRTTDGGIVNAIFSWPLNFLPGRPDTACALPEKPITDR